MRNTYTSLSSVLRPFPAYGNHLLDISWVCYNKWREKKELSVIIFRNFGLNPLISTDTERSIS